MQEEIQEAFKQLALIQHPDTSSKAPSEASKEFKALLAANDAALQQLGSAEQRRSPAAAVAAAAPSGGPPVRDQAANFAHMMSRKDEVHNIELQRTTSG